MGWTVPHIHLLPQMALKGKWEFLPFAPQDQGTFYGRMPFLR